MLVKFSEMDAYIKDHSSFDIVGLAKKYHHIGALNEAIAMLKLAWSSGNTARQIRDHGRHLLNTKKSLETAYRKLGVKLAQSSSVMDFGLNNASVFSKTCLELGNHTKAESILELSCAALPGNFLLSTELAIVHARHALYEACSSHPDESKNLFAKAETGLSEALATDPASPNKRAMVAGWLAREIYMPQGMLDKAEGVLFDTIKEGGFTSREPLDILRHVVCMGQKRSEGDYYSLLAKAGVEVGQLEPKIVVSSPKQKMRFTRIFVP